MNKKKTKTNFLRKKILFRRSFFFYFIENINNKKVKFPTLKKKKKRRKTPLCQASLCSAPFLSQCDRQNESPFTRSPPGGVLRGVWGGGNIGHMCSRSSSSSQLWVFDLAAKSFMGGKSAKRIFVCDSGVKRPKRKEFLSASFTLVRQRCVIFRVPSCTPPFLSYLNCGDGISVSDLQMQMVYIILYWSTLMPPEKNCGLNDFLLAH